MKVNKDIVFFTPYNYDSSFFSPEVNASPSLTSQEDYESLADKLARFTSFGFPQVYSNQYDESDDPVYDPGFDIADLDEYDFNDVTAPGQPAPVSPNEPNNSALRGGVGPHIASATTSSAESAQSETITKAGPQPSVN